MRNILLGIFTVVYYALLAIVYLPYALVAQKYIDSVKLRMVGWIPTVVLTDLEGKMDKKLGGLNMGLIIIMPKGYGDVALRHELVHARQYVRSLGLSPLIYLVSDVMRLRYETEAYVEMNGSIPLDLLKRALGEPIYRLSPELIKKEIGV